MKKKILSVLMTAVMAASLCSVLPTMVSADSNLDTAVNYTLGTTVSDMITNTQNKVLYKFTISNSGRISLSSVAKIYRVNYYIYNSVGEEVWYCTRVCANDNTGQSSIFETIDLLSGTYYFCVEQNSGTGEYNFKMTFSSANESFSESYNNNDNELALANSINIGTKYNGQIAVNDSKDFYKFTLSSSKRLVISSVAKIYRVNYYIYNSVGDEVWYCTRVCANDNTGQSSISETIDLSSGTYYFCVEQNSGTGNYSFSISYPTPTKSSSSSSSKSTTASSKKPSQVLGVYLKKGGKKTAKISWSKVSGAKGYQVKYSTSKKFKKAKTKTKTVRKNKVTLKKLIKKKYFVKVRAYKKVSGKKVYGKWSKTLKLVRS